MNVPTERIVFQFDNATVIYTAEHSAATGKVMPKLYVQAIDQYRFQRELIVEFRHEPGDSKKLFWEYHIYQHPGRRHVAKVSEYRATKFINRFLHLCKDYPDLLFNKSGDRPRHEGFVFAAEFLHRGFDLSVRLL
jgi:hypothetical protein